jgi:hypothetical protein
VSVDEVFEGVPRHPDADKLDVGTWDKAGHCICGEPLPAQKDWDGQPHPWPSVTCQSCGRCYVDEEDFIAIYDDGCDVE